MELTGAEDEAFQENGFNTTAVDALAPWVAKPLAAMALTI